jgi:type I restriction enzyme S subunit
VKTGERDTKDRVDGGAFPFFVRSQTVERIDTWSFDGEAVLTAGDGNGGVGKVFHYVNGKFDYHQRVYKFSHFKEVSGRFFFEYLRATLKFEALAGNSRSTVNLSLRQPMLLNFPCVLPPISEQAAIVEYIGRATFTLDATITRARREIELLNEYRTRLIADLVTGKLDVREAAARLPEEVSDADMADEPAADAETDESEELVEAVGEETGA